MKTILVPIDFSAVTQNVVAQAVSLAKLTKARLVLLHVVQPPAYMANYGFAGEFVAPPVDTLKDAVSGQLIRWKRLLQGRGLKVTVAQSADSVAASSIVAEAKRWSASYIVIGSHGHAAFYDLLIGSTTSGVIKRSPCPVLIVPAHHKPTKGTAARKR